MGAARAESDWVDVVLVGDGEEQDHKGYVDRKSIELPYVVSELVGKSYGVSKLPYAVLISENQSVASMGIVNSRSIWLLCLKPRSAMWRRSGNT